MKKFIFFFFFLICTKILTAQNETPVKYSLINSSDLVGCGSLEILDPYLSPLVYSGMGFKYEHTERKFLSPENTKLSMESKFSILTGITVNPANTSAMTFFGSNYSWGLHHHFSISRDLQFLAGGTADAIFGFKSNLRNVNNPINLDMATNLNLSGLLRYNLTTGRRVIQFTYGLGIPFLGYMFVPQGGASYYEMFSLSDMSDAFNFSSLHNKRGTTGLFMVDIPFKHSTWRFGFNSVDLKYTANDMVFKHNEFNLMIGWKHDLYIFSGYKNLAPENFINADK